MRPRNALPLDILIGKDSFAFALLRSLNAYIGERGMIIIPPFGGCNGNFLMHFPSFSQVQVLLKMVVNVYFVLFYVQTDQCDIVG